VNHPVELGLVASLNRPGGNVTGMSMFTAEIAAKNISLLKEMVPAATIVASLINPTSPAAKIYSDSVVTAGASRLASSTPAQSRIWMTLSHLPKNSVLPDWS